MQTEIIEQIIHLPIAERVEIIEKISRSVKEELRESETDENSIERRKLAYTRLRGIAAVKGKTPPTDDEVKESFINHLSEKHS
jgi:hypothetical protein